jgi:hypothetical protein
VRILARLTRTGGAGALPGPTVSQPRPTQDWRGSFVGFIPAASSLQTRSWRPRPSRHQPCDRIVLRQRARVAHQTWDEFRVTCRSISVGGGAVLVMPERQSPQPKTSSALRVRSRRGAKQPNDFSSAFRSKRTKRHRTSIKRPRTKRKIELSRR